MAAPFAKLQLRRVASVAQAAVDALPQQVQPYAKLMRLDKPVGTWLLFWPGAWSIALAEPLGSLPSLHLLALFGAGSLIMRGAGCTVNDMWDRSYDAKVTRTMERPLASGALTTRQAVYFLAAQLSAGLAILLNLNNYSVVLGASSLALVATYPLMKRFTYWPQAFLGNWRPEGWEGCVGGGGWGYRQRETDRVEEDGEVSHAVTTPQFPLLPLLPGKGLTFNWGALLGWSAVQGSCDWGVVVPLYAGSLCWTIVYDTIYAHQDKTDDVKIGVKSTALLFAGNTKPILGAFTGLMAGSWALAGMNAGQVCSCCFELQVWFFSPSHVDSETL